MWRRSKKNAFSRARPSSYAAGVLVSLAFSSVFVVSASAMASIKISGKVWTDERTTPSAAAVRVMQGSQKACETCEVTTEIGEYQLTMALTPGRYTLKAYDKVGRWLADTQVRVLNEGSNNNIDFTLRRPVARVSCRGTIRNSAGQEWASVEVMIYLPECEGCVVAHAKTNARGEFETPELAAFSSYQIAVVVNGLLSPLQKLFISTTIGYQADLTVDRKGSGFEISARPDLLRMLRPSQKASVLQTIGVTDITITYSRPPVKGRTIFGDAPYTMEARAKGEATLDNQNERQKGEPIVPYGHVWRAGANEATMFAITDDVLINGQPLKAGTYSLHTVPGKEEWTIIFNNDAGQWGSFTFDEEKNALRVKTKPQMVSENQEWLEYTFDPVTENTAQVNIRWEKMRVPFTVEIKDVKALWRAKADVLIAANPTNEVLPLQVAITYAGDKKWDEALKFVDQSIKIKGTFRNLVAKVNILWAAGRKEEALAVADVAIAKGKAEKADTAAFERRMAAIKAGNP